MSPNHHIVWLNETNSTHTQATMGSKAANLARLCDAGLPVPAAFCITVDAWVDHFANTNQTVASPPDMTGLLPTASPGSDLEREILEAYRMLCARFGEKIEVVVRSSALSEDMANASFAGQYESYLNIQNEGDLLTAVKRCWASGWSEQVSAYTERCRASQPDTSRGMAIIVQQMIQAELAGVLFTLDPVSGATDCIVIEAVPGLAADFVSGTVNPARLVIDKYDHQIVRSDHVSIIPAHFSQSNAWAQLVELALQVEKTFQSPQDIEWAFQDGQFWILQTRPITVRPSHSDISNYTRANIGEVMPGVVTPLTWSTFIRALQMGERDDQQVRPSEISTLINGRAYMDMQIMWDNYSHILGINPATVLGRGLGCDLRGREAALSAASPPVGIATTLRKTTYVWLEMLTPGLTRPRIKAQLQHQLEPALKVMGQEKINGHDSLEVWHDIERLLQLASRAFLMHMHASFIALCAYAYMRDSLVKVVGKEVADSLVSTTFHSPMSAAALHSALRALASEVKASPETVRLFSNLSGDQLFGALSKNQRGQLLLDQVIQAARLAGDRAVQEFELRAPRWSEDPRPLLVTLRALIVGGGDSSKSSMAQAKPERRMELAHVLRFISMPQRWLLGRVHRAFLIYSKLREETKSALVTCFAEMRRRYVHLGNRLHANGLLDQKEDIFFLSVNEIPKVLTDRSIGAKYRDSIRERRAIHAEYETRDLSATGEVTVEEGSVLSGTAVSGGRVTGRARVVLNPALASLRQGDILITEYTDPGWTPLFLIADAIVTEVGGMLSHTATLARELNKPAVFSVAGATRLIHNGQLITVDGWRGQVHLHAGEADS